MKIVDQQISFPVLIKQKFCKTEVNLISKWLYRNITEWLLALFILGQKAELPRNTAHQEIFLKYKATELLGRERLHHTLHEQSFSELQQGITDLDLSWHIHSFLLKVPRVCVLYHYYG